MPKSALEIAIDQFRSQVLARDAIARERLIQAYADAMRRLQSLVELTQVDIDKLIAEGKAVSPYKIFQLDRWQELERQLQDELATVGRWAEIETTAAQRSLVAMSPEHARQLALVQQQNQAGILKAWANVPPNAIADLIGTTVNGAPLATLFDMIGPGAVDIARESMTSALALGQHPRIVANVFRDVLGQSFTRSYTIARTEMLRAYRSAAIREYQANADILDGWVWVAAHSDRTCAACLALDGRVFPLEERFMRQHVNCRCSAAPSIAGSPWERENGKDWLKKQSADRQDRILGKSGGEAFRAGEVELDDFVREDFSRVWGASYRDGGIGWAKEKAANNQS